VSALDDDFVESARKKPFEYEHGTNVVVFTPVDLTAQFDKHPSHAELKVTMDDRVIGYITSFRSDEKGVVSAERWGTDDPEHFHTVEGALEFLLPGVADHLGDKPEL